MLAEIPEEKRSGNTVSITGQVSKNPTNTKKMSYVVDTMIHLSNESISKARCTLVKAVYLKRIKSLLEDEPQKVISWMEEIRKSICSPSNFRVLVVADIEKLSNPVSSWKLLLEGLDTTKPLRPLDKQIDHLSEAGKSPGKLAYVVPMPTIDSSFSIHTSRGPDSYLDPSLPALAVAVAYLDAVEGPLWRAVRGTGLAYGTYFTRELESGLIMFRVYRSPDAYKAFAAARKVIENFISGFTPFETHALEGAISSIVVGFADEQPSMSSAAQISFVNQVIRGVPKDYNAQMLSKVRDVGVEEIKSALKRWIMPTFEPGTADVVCACAPVMEKVSLF
jgi:Zn-dependent M16 (insulinase) family peptidase